MTLLNFVNGFLVSFACHLFLFHQIRHRWTGRFEAHLWDKTSWNKIQNKKGKQGNFTKVFFNIWFFFDSLMSFYEIRTETCIPDTTQTLTHRHGK